MLRSSGVTGLIKPLIYKTDREVVKTHKLPQENAVKKFRNYEIIELTEKSLKRKEETYGFRLE